MWKGLTLLVISWMLWNPETMYAGVYDNAYAFYQSYGSEMSFLPGANNEGEIYYATKGKKNSGSGIRYTTIGWKIRIFQETGACVETIYYQLNGKHMTSIDVQTRDGYEYSLYRVTLDNLKSRLSAAGLEALKKPGSNIVFDACISIRRNGKLEGGMTDEGPSWGNVYTTYNGIAYAQSWSKETRESLKSYYNKIVEDLFYTVKLQKLQGIQTVSGAGRYCFGTRVTIQAECADGYHFSEWIGNFTSDANEYSFMLYAKDVELTANAKENQYRIVFENAGGRGRIPERVLSYGDMLELPANGVDLEGAALSGWETSTNNETMKYAAGESIPLKELVKALGLERTHGATIVLCASWDEGPLIQTEEIYVSLTDAVTGKITEEWLARKAEAYDLEDGEIPYGKNQNTSFFMEDYQLSDFTQLQGEGSISKTFLAIDSAGNTTRKEILVHIAETKTYPKEKLFGRVRFISEKYFWDETENLISETQGGLAEDSIWRKREDYRKLLENLFKEKRR